MCRILAGKQRGPRSGMLAFLSALLLCTLLMILKQHTTTGEILSPLSLKQFTLSRCRQFTEKERIDWKNLYYIQDLSKKKSLIWCKVPKAGSSTLARKFIRLAGATKNFTIREIHDTFSKLYPALSPKTMATRLNSTFKFLVVRHPFERILSAYRDKLEDYSRDPPFRKYGKAMVKRPTYTEPTFPEFVTYLIETSPNRFNEHWMPISWLCAPCSIHYDAIVKIENFHMDIKVPLGQVGIHSDIGWEHSTGTDNDTIERYFQQLSFTQIQKLYHLYQEDFLLFDYPHYKYFLIVARATTKAN